MEWISNKSDCHKHMLLEYNDDTFQMTNVIKHNTRLILQNCFC